MGAFDFETGGTAQTLRAGATGYATLGTAHTQAALCTVESVPTDGIAFPAAIAMQSGTTARLLTIALDSANSGTIASDIGSNFVKPGTNIIPPIDVPILIVIAKDAGTVAPRFLLHNYATATTTYDNAGATVVDRTAGACTATIGNFNVGNTEDWDGLIGAVGQWNRALSEGEMRALVGGRGAWISMFGRTVTKAAELFVDLTQPGTVRDMFNPEMVFTATGAAFVPEPFRWPGW